MAHTINRYTSLWKALKDKGQITLKLPATNHISAYKTIRKGIIQCKYRENDLSYKVYHRLSFSSEIKQEDRLMTIALIPTSKESRLKNSLGLK